MSDDAVLIERHGAVALLRMNRPGKRNALEPGVYEGLSRHLAALQDDTACRAVVLSGGRHFCAGGSLDALSQDALQMSAAMREGQRVVQALVHGRWPVVAAVEGAAYGAGLSLVAACDFVVADAQARFGAVYGTLALMPDWGALWTLPQRIGLGATRRLCMLNEVISSQEALRLGLVDELVDEGEVLRHALGLAARLAQAAPGAVSATKAAMARWPLPLGTLLDWEADRQALLIASNDFAEGRAAFFDKRSPRFEGR